MRPRSSRPIANAALLASLLGVAPAALAAGHPFAQTWNIHKTAARGGVVHSAGTVHGAPLGPGTIQVQTAAHPGARVSFAFRERLGRGSIAGRGQLTYQPISGQNAARLTGTGRVTGGSGRLARARPSFRLSGTAYPNATETITIRIG